MKQLSAMALAAVVFSTWLLLTVTSARADAEFVLQTVNEPGTGFNDITPVLPVGGNNGRTLGEQRRIAVQYAADLWGEVLDSTVPIVIRATFEDLGCDDPSGAILASAAPFAAIDNLQTRWADPNRIYPSALADRLLSTDVQPGQPDIRANFNSSIDEDGCQLPVRWYYGLDGAGAGADLVQTTLHELAHGLGMTLLVDAETGELMLGKPDPFGAQIYDHVFNSYLDELSDPQRIEALTHAHQVAFDGPRTTEAARAVLKRRAPAVTTTPIIPGFSGLAADTNFSDVLGTGTEGISAPLVVAKPEDGCTPASNAIGNILLVRPRCYPDQVAEQAQQAGAVGVVLALSEHWNSPPSPLDLDDAATSRIPVVVISQNDADQLAAAMAAGPLEVELAPSGQRRAGTDSEGRVLVNATSPVTASMLSHWDMSARPNLLMEPFVRPVSDLHGLDLTLPALQDLGWTSPCGNGVLDTLEACDDGAGNSDTSANACRTDCTLPECGDGVVDDGEQCDHAGQPENADPCTANCLLVACTPASDTCSSTETGGSDVTPNSGGGVTASGGQPADSGGESLEPTPVPLDDGGCGCRVAGRPATSRSEGAWLLALYVFVRARRRTSPSSESS